MKTKLPVFLLAAVCQFVCAEPDYKLHEWGTFTTVSGSDGVLLPGLQREEEQLPAFVHAHLGFENGQAQGITEAIRMFEKHGTMGFNPIGSKGLGQRPVSGVTVKMETPVIYFHSEEGFKAKVKVGFHGGTISQWYPSRSGGEVLPEPPAPADPKKNPTPLKAWEIDFSRGWNGSIDWTVNVLSAAESREAVLFKPQDNLGWLRARVPGANVVRTADGETEGYLFYRGVGAFDPGLKTTVDEKDTLHVLNRTGGVIPWMIAFEITPDGRPRWKELHGGLPAGGEAGFTSDGFTTGEPGKFPEALYRTVLQGLNGCGLTREEARAMVETWWTSYFQAPGLRVFWVVPRASVDRILPLEVNPAPRETVRVIVGRSEIFRRSEEAAWVRLAAEAAAQGPELSPAVYPSLVSSHRFGLAIDARVKALGAAR